MYGDVPPLVCIFKEAKHQPGGGDAGRRVVFQGVFVCFCLLCGRMGGCFGGA